MSYHLQSIKMLIQAELKTLLSLEKDKTPAQLFSAMDYALLAPGKRLRPYLVFMAADLFDLEHEQALPLALALECVHCYSLVHDDLPCMDDADLRRSLPTVHKQFDEATALLAGNALFTLAFKVLSSAESISPVKRCAVIRMLADASGGAGMMGGQMLDLLGEKSAYKLEQIEEMQVLKTGALIEFALLAPAHLANASPDQITALQHYAASLGLAYQIADDLMDIRQTSAEAGKTTGLDAVHGKSTFVSLLGEAQAEQRLKDLQQQAIQSLRIFGEKARGLEEFVSMIGQD